MQTPINNFSSCDHSLASASSYEPTDEYIKFINFQNLSFSDSPNYMGLPEEETSQYKLAQKSKRIMKREQAKQRTKERVLLKKEVKKEEIKTESEKISMKEEEFDDDSEDVTEKDKKKMQQKIRNRVSAQQSRDRKKVYIVNLEQQNSVLVEENTLLKQDLMFLKQENEQLKEENYYLKSQLNRKVGEDQENPTPLDSALDSESTNPNYLYEETTSSAYSSPFHNSNGGSSKKLFKYGLALLTIISLVMFLGFSSGEKEMVNVYRSKDVGTDIMLRNEVKDEEKIEMTEYPALKYLKNYRREIMNQILVVEDQKGNTKKNSLVPVPVERKGKFLEDKNETQLVLFNENQEYPLSTLFCPKTYIYESQETSENSYNNTGRVAGISEWVHLLIPKNDMSQFYVRDDEIVIKNVKQEDVRISMNLGNYNKYEDGWNSMLELWCKVSGIREISEIRPRPL